MAATNPVFKHLETRSGKEFTLQSPAFRLSRFLNLNLLLIFVPLALLAQASHSNAVLVFVLSGLAIIPLSGIIGTATEIVAERVSPQIGGLLNATLGNAAELILTIFALREGLVDLVRASIVGTVLGNLLLVTGLSILLGGLRHGSQKFEQRTASINATLMILAFLALSIPSLFDPAVIGEPIASAADRQREVFFSVGIAGFMIFLYVLTVIYSLRNAQTQPDVEAESAAPAGSLRNAILLLMGATVAIVLMSDTLVGTVEPVVNQLKLSEFFIGIIVIPFVGDITEHMVAVRVALKNRMDLSLSMSLGAGLQAALFVAPVLVFISLLFANPLLLVFNRYELIALAAASVVAMLVSQDGESNWLEGAELVVVYLIIALAFYVIPGKP